MAKQRLSKLQKNILCTLYNNSSKGIFEEDAESISKNDKEGIKKLEDKGYKFTNEFLKFPTNEPTGDLRYVKKIPKYQMRREALLFNIYDWQKYNLYTKECGFARINNSYWGKGKPKGYNKKQATFTRSLQTLAARDLIWLLGQFEQPISIYGKIFACKMGVKPETIDEYKEEGLKRYKDIYNKEKKENPKIGIFEDWFNKPIRPQFRGMPLGSITSRKKNYITDYGKLSFRNTKYIKLTTQGLEKAKKLLKVK